MKKNNKINKINRFLTLKEVFMIQSLADYLPCYYETMRATGTSAVYALGMATVLKKANPMVATTVACIASLAQSLMRPIIKPVYRKIIYTNIFYTIARYLSHEHIQSIYGSDYVVGGKNKFPLRVEGVISIAAAWYVTSTILPIIGVPAQLHLSRSIGISVCESYIEKYFLSAIHAKMSKEKNWPSFPWNTEVMLPVFIKS